jgi:(2Fe-2S) ferredoxin
MSASDGDVRPTVQPNAKLARKRTTSAQVGRRVPPQAAGHEATPPEAPDAARQAAHDGLTANIWEKHVFVCTSGKYCPTVDGDGLGVHARLKQLVAAAGLNTRVRVNHSGCLDQCGYGPMVVVYPESVWYWGVQPEDVDEIVREHLAGGRPVERLRYRNHLGKNKLPRDDLNRPIGRPVRSSSGGERDC